MSEVTYKRICIVAISLGKGGAERSTALLSQLLAEKGHQVTVVILNNRVDYPFAGKLLNLGLHKTGQNSLWHAFIRMRQFKKFLKQERIEVVIDNRTRQSSWREWLYITWLYRKLKVVYVCRSAHIAAYFPSRKAVTQKMFFRASAIVGVSKGIAQILQDIHAGQFKHKVLSIYNPVPDFSSTKSINKPIATPYILFLGRFVEAVKNFTLLLEAYAASVLPHNKIKLVLLGEGPDKALIKAKAQALNISELVVLKPFTADVFPWLQHANYLVLTSFYEGFPRVLVEALSAGTPVISVNCKTGPDEIIKHEQNGLLLPNHNVQALASAFTRFVKDPALYAQCKQNAIPSVAHLSHDTIATEWQNLIMQL